MTGERIAELEQQLNDACNLVADMDATAVITEQRKAVLREALETAQNFIEEKCNSGADNEGWLSMIPEDVSKVWQILEAALEVK